MKGKNLIQMKTTPVSLIIEISPNEDYELAEVSETSKSVTVVLKRKEGR